MALDARAEERETRGFISITEEYPQYSLGIKWSLIREKLEERFEVTVEEADVREGMAKQVQQYLQGMDNPEFVESTVNRLMADQNQVRNMANEIGTKKLFVKISEEVSLNEKAVSIEEFRTIVQERNEKN